MIEESLGVGDIPWGKLTSGIYNYCDKWCEKCDRTEKCFLFFMEEADKEERENDKHPLDTVGRSMASTKNLIERIAQAEGLDLTTTEEDEREYERYRKVTNPENDPHVKESLAVYEELAQLLGKLRLINYNEFEEDFDNLSWHHSLIYPKVAMAVSGLLECDHEEDAEMKCIHKNDSKNSAWVAYRSLSICINSLETIWSHTKDSGIRVLLKRCGDLLKNIEAKLL